MNIRLLWLLLVISDSITAQVPVGVQLYSFRNQFKESIPSTLKAMQQMGIRYAEGGDSYGMAPQEFKKQLDEHGIKVMSIGADFEQLRNKIDDVIATARLYGASYVVCFWIPHQGDQLTKDEADAAIGVFNEAGRRLRKAGLTLCYHPHGYEFAPLGNGTIFDHFVNTSDPESLSFEMDVYWIKQAGQEPLSLLRKYPARFKLMHLKDRRPGTPSSNNGHADVETNVTLGKGDVGIADLVKEARKLKLAHLFIEDESSRSLSQVPESLAYLKTIK